MGLRDSRDKGTEDIEYVDLGSEVKKEPRMTGCDQQAEETGPGLEGGDSGSILGTGNLRDFLSVAIPCVESSHK
jgi:hypothetical protein